MDVAVSVCASVVLSACASSPTVASLTRSVTVDAPPAAVWSVIGPYCAIEDWLPPIGSCVLNAETPPTRTLVTRDGAGTFVEAQTARSDQRHFYSYTFKSSPLPVTRYNSTIQVTAGGQGNSIVTWRSTYTPDAGKEAAANEALGGVYDSGLAAIKARFAK